MKICKRCLFMFALSLSLVGLGDTWTDDGVTYSYTVSGDVACISITSCGESASVVIPSEVNGYKVTSIGQTSSDCRERIVSVTIPNSVTNLGTWAFKGCSGLTSITIPKSVRRIGWSAFEGCSGLTSATIPESVLSEGVDCVFNMRENLKSITISDDVTYIRWPSFRDCVSLTSVIIPDSVREIQDGAFEGCSEALYDKTTIPGLNIIDGWVIGYNSDCPSDLRIEGVRGVADNALSRCENLVSVSISEDVQNLGWGLFSGCGALTSVSLPAGMTEIGASMFDDCARLVSVSIPDSVTKIGGGAFNYCKSLYSIDIPTSVTNIDAWAFANCDQLMSITIPGSVTEIGTQAFFDCERLWSVVFEEGATSIGGAVFYNCHCLWSVTIPDSMETIGGGAFSGCGLWEISVPEDTEIKEYAFDKHVNIIRRELKTSPLLYMNLKGAANPNPATYKEGRNLELLPLADIPGYIFKGWSPAKITLDMKGEKIITANWVKDPSVFPRSITEAKISVSIPKEGYKYDGEPKEPVVDVSDIGATILPSDYSITYSNNVNAGEARVVVTGTGNYTGTVDVVFNIAPRELTFTSADCGWVYDGAAHSCTVTPEVSGDGFVGSDGVTFSDFASVVELGRYENTFSYTFTVGTVSSNYSVAQVYGVLLVSHLKATIKDDGTIRIDGFGNEVLDSSELSIPERIYGIPVTEIKADAFANSESGVQTLKLSKYCKTIGTRAFLGVKSLKKVVFVQVYNTDDTPAQLVLGAYAFGSTEVEEIVIPDYVYEIGDYAFSNCGNLKRVKVQGGTTFSSKAFYRSGLTTRVKPEVITFSTFSYQDRTATMTVKGTGGTIDLTNLKIYFSEDLGADAAWSERAYETGGVVLTDTGCEVTVTATIPEGKDSGYFKAVLSE